ENDHRLRSVLTRPHENARKRIKRCHTPNAHSAGKKPKEKSDKTKADNFVWTDDEVQ
ncbi:unnamed protein product, partial [Porites evermanni]